MGNLKPARKPSPQASLADTLFSSTQQKVLGRLFGQADRSFYATELIQAAGGGSGAVQRELARLEASGLVEASRIGNQKHYQANRESPIFEELAGIFRHINSPATPSPATLKAAEPAASYAVGASLALRRLKITPAALASFCKKRGIKTLSFFGSVTRGDFGPDSDVDVMVEFAPDKAPSLFGMVDLQDDLSRLFKGRPVDVTSPRILQNPYRRRTIERDLQVAYAA